MLKESGTSSNPTSFFTGTTSHTSDNSEYRMNFSNMLPRPSEPVLGDNPNANPHPTVFTGGKFPFDFPQDLELRRQANLAVSPGGFSNLATSPGSIRRKQKFDADFNTSIDFTASSGEFIPQIIKAAQEGSRDEVERLIDQGCDIEARHSGSNRNAFLVAAHCGNDDIVDLLI